MRQLLMIEVEGDDAAVAAERLVTTFPDAVVWGEVDPVQAALFVIDGEPAFATV